MWKLIIKRTSKENWQTQQGSYEYLYALQRSLRDPDIAWTALARKW